MKKPRRHIVLALALLVTISMLAYSIYRKPEPQVIEKRSVKDFKTTHLHVAEILKVHGQANTPMANEILESVEILQKSHRHKSKLVSDAKLIMRDCYLHNLTQESEYEMKRITEWFKKAN